MELDVWKVILTGVVTIMGFILKDKFTQVDDLRNLLNKTREEVARDHITRTEFRADMEKLREHFDDGFSRLERKLDDIRNRREKDSL